MQAYGRIADIRYFMAGLALHTFMFYIRTYLLIMNFVILTVSLFAFSVKEYFTIFVY